MAAHVHHHLLAELGERRALLQDDPSYASISGVDTMVRHRPPPL